MARLGHTESSPPQNDALRQKGQGLKALVRFGAKPRGFSDRCGSCICLFLCGKMGKRALFVEKNTCITTAFDRLRRLSMLYYGQAPEETPKGTGFGQK